MEKRKISKKDFNKASIEINTSEKEAIELDKKRVNEEIERNKRYLIEDVLLDGEMLYQEILNKDKKKRSFWNRLMDFIFK